MSNHTFFFEGYNEAAQAMAEVYKVHGEYVEK
jgi:hypothetical protein